MLLVDRYIVTEPPRPCFGVRFGSSGSAGPLLTVLLLSLLKISSNGEILHGANVVPRLRTTPHALAPSAGIFAHFLQYVVGGLEGIEAGWNPTIDRSVQ